MGYCRKCGTGSGIVLLVFGALYLLKDLGVLPGWNVSWWTIAFILAGFGMWGCARCADCQGCCGETCAPEKKKKQ